MRRTFGVLLVGLGLFGVVLAVLLPTVVVSRSKKIPLDIDITLVSSGPAKVLNPETNQLQGVELQATRYARTDTSASDDTNTTWDVTVCTVVKSGKTQQCLPKTDPRLLSITYDRVTFDRKSAEAVNVPKYGNYVENFGVRDTKVQHEGLSYTWPIDADKKTYMWFQPDIGKAFPATFEGTDSINGLTVYKYLCKTGVQTAVWTGGPFLVKGTFPGSYDDTREVWVEPRTGVIIKGVEHQVQRILDANNPSSPGQLALETTLTFDQSAIDFQSNYAKNKIDKLRFLQLWGPLAAGIIGVAALVGAFFLLRPRRPTGGDTGDEGEHGPPAPDDDTNHNEPPVWAGSGQPEAP